MEVVRKISTVRILSALYNQKEKELYTTELARKTNLSLRHIDRVLPKMLEEGLIEVYQKNNKKYYKLTDKGRALAFALNNLDDLVKLLADSYLKEETARERSRRELVQRIILNLFRDTGLVYPYEFVENIVKGLGLTLDKIAKCNSYEEMKKIEDTIKNFGPAHTMIKIEKNGRITDVRYSRKFLKPEERIKIE